MVKKFNELNESKIDDVFDENQYSNTFEVKIESEKKDVLFKLKKWCEKNNYIPEKKTINEILNSYYYFILNPTSEVNEFFFEYTVNNQGDYAEDIYDINDAIEYVIKDEEGEELYNKKKKNFAYP